VNSPTAASVKREARDIQGFLLKNPVCPALLYVPRFPLIYFLGLAIVFSTLQQIFLTGAYLYATEGVVAPGFEEEVLREAFRKRQPNKPVES